MKLLRLVLVLMLALTLLTFAGGSALASTIVDQRAELDLIPYVEGASGTAELRLKIDEDGMLELFRIKVDAEGLKPGGTFNLVKGMHVIATGTADDNGKLSFDETLDMFHKDTLVGLKIKVVCAKTGFVVLAGKVTEEHLVD